MYLLGYDIGSSSVKAALINAQTGMTLAVTQSPADAMPIDAPFAGWAEQDPEMWWKHVCIATRKLLQSTAVDPMHILGIGIAYQMHGLVCVDRDQCVLRPAIIWCDSRAVEIGEHAYAEIGAEKCLAHLLNSPGNFTASKLKWVKDYEPETYARISKCMLPGDYITMRLTGEIATTPAGLSEGMLWDFVKEGIADFVIDHYGLDEDMLPNVVPICGIHGSITATAAEATGLAAGTPVAYRAGDQPNNALALGVLQPGQYAASGGTSGVVYGISATPVSDPLNRVNSFLHVNHTQEVPRIGVLLCINGTGIQYQWIRQHVAQAGTPYAQMEAEAAQIAPGAEGMRILPFGNGAERMLGNRNPGAAILHGDFNRHTRAHLYRAALEGIACAFAYGMYLMQDMGLRPDVIRTGNDHLFQSGIFSAAVAALAGCRIDLVETTGAAGAAQAAGVAAGVFVSLEDAVSENAVLRSFEPLDTLRQQYQDVYAGWKNNLERLLKNQ